MYGRLSRIFIIVLLTTVSFLQVAFGSELKILAIRVDFILDENEGTTGNGKFLLDFATNQCGNYTVDPPPHNKSYFESQILAIDNYYKSVSNGKFGIDLENSAIFPIESNMAYTMPNTMSYYHPFISDLSQAEIDLHHEEKIVQLLSDAITTAYQTDNVSFNQYDVVVVIHAGVSQDFDFGIDTTPEDIPSTYIDDELISKYYGNNGITVGNSHIKQGIILPETQNHILFPEMIDYFRQSGVQNVCNYQYGLTGTFAMLVGQAIGLPPLWNTDTGESGVGVFGLMDQGSNNGQGLIPAPPMAWNRILMGWEETERIIPDAIAEIEALPVGNTLKVDIDNDEYFLIENRTNWFRENVDIDSVRRNVYDKTGSVPNIIEIIFDSVGVTKDENGVIISIPDYDIGLPGSGLLIWHVDESIIAKNIHTKSINNDPKLKGIDLEEAGGPQDIGYVSTALFRNPSIGEPFDMWYQGNPEYDEVNSQIKGKPIEFSSMTYPNTNSNNGARSHIHIGNIGKPSEIMPISISNDLIMSGFPDTSLNILYHTDITGDGVRELIGGVNKLWISNTNNIDKKVFYDLPSTDNLFSMTNVNNGKNLVVASDLGDSIIINWFEYNSGFVLKRASTIYDTLKLNSYLKGSLENDSIQIIDDVQKITLVNKKIGSSINAEIPENGGIIIGDQFVAFNETKFQYLSAIDLELDGKIDVLVLDINGKLYAFNQNYTNATGFPLDVQAIPPVLAKNILGDEKPEIIFQNSEGEIIVLNNAGELQYRLANHKNNRLRMLSEYNNKNCVVSESTIWSFDEVSPSYGNEWTMYHHDEINSNEIEIEYDVANVTTKSLIDKKRTYIYPNPVRDGKVTIRIFNYSAESTTIKIYDAAGYFVDEINDNFEIKNDVWETEWDVSNIESGIYLIKLNVSNKTTEESAILKLGVIH